MNQRICRWGILGAATIARKNWKAIRNASNCTLSAVASRDLDKARQFIQQCQFHAPMDSPPEAVGGYEALLARSDIDAVYIPLPTVVRKEWAIRAAESGKHILVEKPVGATARDVEDILDACRRNRVQFMDGVMFMHSGRLTHMRAVLDDGHSIGVIRRIATQFSVSVPDEFLETDIRSRSDLEPLGALGDLGWYNIRFILWAMKDQLPQRVSGRLLSEHHAQDSPASIPTEFSAELFYPHGVSASYYCSFVTQLQQWAHVSGTKGCLQVQDFVLPLFGAETAFDVPGAEFDVVGCDFNMRDHARRVLVREHSNSAEDAQETNMFRHFAELAFSAAPDPEWGEIALRTQKTLDACLESARREGALVELA